MTKASLAGLIEFINSQPANRPVNHDSWATCAVGDYARAIGEQVTDSAVHGFRALRADPILKKLWRQAGSTDCDVLNDYEGVQELDDPSYMDILCGMRSPRTYGEMRAELRVSLAG